MAGSFTDAAELDVLRLITGKAATLLGAGATPITPFVGLFTTMPTDSTGGTEATGGGYARITAPAASWGTPAAGAVSNSAAITFAQFSGSVSSGAAFLGFGIFSAVSAGTLLAYGTLTDQTKTGGNGDTLSFAIGALTITAD